MLVAVLVASLLTWGSSSAQPKRAYEPGTVSIHISSGIGKPFEGGIGAAGRAGAALGVGIGRRLSLSAGASYSKFAKSHYFLDFPLSLSSYLASEGFLPLQISGGVGIAFSDLRQWEHSNRALSAHLAIGATILSREKYGLASELIFIKAATSTGNISFGFLILKMNLIL